jgi:hypothetical protein
MPPIIYATIAFASALVCLACAAYAWVQLRKARRIRRGGYLPPLAYTSTNRATGIQLSIGKETSPWITEDTKSMFVPGPLSPHPDTHKIRLVPLPENRPSLPGESSAPTDTAGEASGPTVQESAG